MRPEHLILSDTGIPVTVELVEPTGAETHVIMKLGTQQIVGVFRERPSIGYGDEFS